MEDHPVWYGKTLYVEGICFLLLGLVGLFAPVIMTFAVELLIGTLFLAGGLVQGWRALTTPKLPGFWPSILSAILYIIVGCLLLFYPLKGVVTLTILLAIFFLVEGLFQIIFSTAVRPLMNWGWVLVSGIVTLILGFLIWSGWPGTSLWAIGLIVGINLIFYGASRLFLARSY